MTEPNWCHVEASQAVHTASRYMNCATILRKVSTSHRASEGTQVCSNLQSSMRSRPGAACSRRAPARTCRRYEDTRPVPISLGRTVPAQRKGGP